jgi:hypothetical protein
MRSRITKGLRMVRVGRLLLILLAIVILAGGCRVAPASSSDVDEDVAEEISSDGTVAVELESLDGESAEAAAEPLDVPLEVELATAVEPIVDNGCVDTDAENNYLQAGYVVYTDPNGALVILYDTCKIEGPNGMLNEVTCNGYHGPETDPAELESKYIKCNCQMGECVEDSIVLCTEPEAGEQYPGGSVWSNEEGKTHISVCKNDSTVDWYYCNEDGTFHADASVCDEGVLCGDGMCGGFACTDTEPPADQSNAMAGKIFMYSPTTGESWLLSDGCKFDFTEVKAYRCPLHTGTTLPPLKDVVKKDPDLIPCGEEEECVFGICKEAEPDPDPDPDSKVCQDSDPNDNIYYAGQVILAPDNAPPQIFPDKCSWFYAEDMSNPGSLLIKKKVLQYQCLADSDKVSSELFDCNENEACVGGACVVNSTVGGTCKFSCYDTDGGKDVLVGGTIFAISDVCGKTGDLHDDCTDDDGVVKERFCVDDTLTTEELPCPPEHFCRDSFEPARCVACKDSDVPDDPTILGEVDDIDGVHVTDFCNSSGQLKQAQCDPNSGLALWSDPEACPPGQKCTEGKCD